MIGPNWPSASAPRRDIPATSAPRHETHTASDTGFAAILTRHMPRPPAPPPDPFGEAAAIRPAIGSTAQSFAASPLLVATTVTAPAGSAASQPAVGEAPSGNFPPPPAAAGLPSALGNALAALLAQVSGAHEAGAPGQGLPHPATATRPAALAGRIDRSTAPAAAPSGVGPMGPGRTTADTKTQQSSPSRPVSPAQRPQGGVWAVHCLPLEGGVRLLIRLTRLSDDTRSELESRLHDLFRQFGLTLRDIDLRETMGGGY